MLPSMFRGKLRFIFKVIEIVVLSSIAATANWLGQVLSGSVDITTYLVDSLCRGICVVLPTEAEPSSWLMTKTSLEVSIKTDLTSFRKLRSSNSGGRMICWLDGIFTLLSIWVFNDWSRWGEVDMFIWTPFSEVMYTLFVDWIILFVNNTINPFPLLPTKWINKKFIKKEILLLNLFK